MILFGCLFGMFAAFAPRLAFLFFWIARPVQVNAAFNDFIFPCLGIIFLPFTTLMWVLLSRLAWALPVWTGCGSDWQWCWIFTAASPAVAMPGSTAATSPARRRLAAASD